MSEHPFCICLACGNMPIWSSSEWAEHIQAQKHHQGVQAYSTNHGRASVVSFDGCWSHDAGGGIAHLPASGGASSSSVQGAAVHLAASGVESVGEKGAGEQVWQAWPVWPLPPPARVLPITVPPPPPTETPMSAGSTARLPASGADRREDHEGGLMGQAGEQAGNVTPLPPTPRELSGTVATPPLMEPPASAASGVETTSTSSTSSSEVSAVPLGMVAGDHDFPSPRFW